MKIMHRSIPIETPLRSAIPELPIAPGLHQALPDGSVIYTTMERGVAGQHYWLRRELWFYMLLAAVVLTAGLPALAQSPYVAASSMALPEASPTTGSDPSDSILTIKKQVSEVNVLFIATDHRGKFVRNLNQADFTILDDHKPPQAIVNFRRETDLPLELGLFIGTRGDE
jgi:hypothetical protein